VLTFANSQEHARHRRATCPSTGCWSRPTRHIWRRFPHRGKRNEPAHVADTARLLAEIKGVEFSQLAQTTRDNTLRLFDKMAITA
jgi:TatD DNase family protein